MDSSDCKYHISVTKVKESLKINHLDPKSIEGTENQICKEQLEQQMMLCMGLAFGASSDHIYKRIKK